MLSESPYRELKKHLFISLSLVLLSVWLVTPDPVRWVSTFSTSEKDKNKKFFWAAAVSGKLFYFSHIVSLVELIKVVLVWYFKKKQLFLPIGNTDFQTGLPSTRWPLYTTVTITCSSWHFLSICSISQKNIKEIFALINMCEDRGSII